MMSSTFLAMTRVSFGVSAVAGASPARPTSPAKATHDRNFRTITLPVFRIVAGAPLAGRRGRNYAGKAAIRAMRWGRGMGPGKGTVAACCPAMLQPVAAPPQSPPGSYAAQSRRDRRDRYGTAHHRLDYC